MSQRIKHKLMFRPCALTAKQALRIVTAVLRWCVWPAMDQWSFTSDVMFNAVYVNEMCFDLNYVVAVTWWFNKADNTGTINARIWTDLSCLLFLFLSFPKNKMSCL